MIASDSLPVASQGIISLDDFYRAYSCFRNLPNDEQAEAIVQPPDEPLLIMAGPGTGKTTCFTLHILKLILVDGVPPKAILATTLTKKAGAELRSRILGWGFQQSSFFGALGIPVGEIPNELLKKPLGKTLSVEKVGVVYLHERND